ncbi:hypothetical protein XELAEV_18022827mg [Xenopus laevis]|uniref:Helix-turn-helix domain-containing protein n=1 Tax=Xenopus laevis TaxID=8355 RepID=A0A974D5N9_XENLA|nr:hypothetical protein XELAEV_18022827mg [Xenopus laevis]
MGSNVAPAYANLYMDYFERMYIYTDSRYTQYCQFYLRYNDDIIMFWTGTIESLLAFCDHLNSVVPTIKFTKTYDLRKINFLDVWIEKDNVRLKTDLFKKETDHNSLLHYNSFHPSTLRNTLPKTQFMRVKRIVSDMYTETERLEEMKGRFLQRGYPKILLDSCIQEVKEIPKNQLIKQRERKETNRLAFARIRVKPKNGRRRGKNGRRRQKTGAGVKNETPVPFRKFFAVPQILREIREFSGEAKRHKFAHH